MSAYLPPAVERGQRHQRSPSTENGEEGVARCATWEARAGKRRTSSSYSATVWGNWDNSKEISTIRVRLTFCVPHSTPYCCAYSRYPTCTSHEFPSIHTCGLSLPTFLFGPTIYGLRVICIDSRDMQPISDPDIGLSEHVAIALPSCRTTIDRRRLENAPYSIGSMSATCDSETPILQLL